MAEWHLMSAGDTDDDIKCPECKGTGRVLLLFSWAQCPGCEGSGLVSEEDRDTGEYPLMQDDGGHASGEGSGATTRCDEAEDPDYFDDGLKLDDDDSGAPGWEGDDS